jgi:adenylate cyclase
VGNIGSNALGSAAPPRARPTTVLFAEVAGGLAARTLDVLGQAAELSGGRVLHRHATGVLALFSTPDAAAAAAARMHAYAQAMVDASESPSVRIGFHSGPVGQRNADVFGDTVNLALKLADQAQSGQILTSHDTASTLSPALQELVRPSGQVKELVWREGLASLVSASGAAGAVRGELRLTYRGQVLVRRREGDLVSIGRDPDCDVQVDDISVSRRHCSIERRGAAFTLRDHSMNGTFVTIGPTEVRAGELPLGSSGTIALGQPASAGGLVVQYSCEFSN